MTKPQMQQVIDEASEILNEAYTPETSREDLAEAVGQVLSVLESDGESGSDEDAGDDGDEDSDDLD